jgi:hypothetical protein
VRVIIAGSRSITDRAMLDKAIADCAWAQPVVDAPRPGSNITEVVSGCAAGADRLGELWSAEHGVPAKKFPAQWDKYGKSAGAIRNGEMAKYAEALIALWDGKSHGTAHMILAAHTRGLKVFVARKEPSCGS